VVCLSHLHPDHCLDLCSYYVARTYAPGGPRPPIPVYGPAATGQRMAQAYGQAGHPGMEEAFSFRTLAEGTWQLGPFEVTTVRVNHPVETFGFRFRQSGRVLTYSADTSESPALVRLASQADLLLSEASFLPWYDPVRSLEEASAVAYDGPVSLAAPGDCFDVG
jgi:ribonuclease BN (tRNA processing enzyme)